MATLPWVTLPEDKRGELWSNAIGGIGDTLIAAQKRKDDEKRHAAEMLIRTREQDRLAKATDSEVSNTASLMDARKQQQEQSAAAQHMEVTKQITSAIDAGHYDMAEQIAKSYKIEVARQPGQKKGDTLMPMTPDDAQLSSPPPEEGPQATPEIAKAAGLERAMQGTPGDASPQAGAAADQQGIDQAEAERQRFAASQAPAPQFAGSQVDAPKVGAWSIDGTKYDPEQTRAADEAARQEEAARVGKAFESTGYGTQAAAFQAAGVKPGETASLVGGMMKGDQAAADRHAEKETQRGWKGEEDAKYRLGIGEQTRHHYATEGIGWKAVGARGDAAAPAGAPEIQDAVAAAVQNGATQEQAVHLARSLGAKDPTKVVLPLMRETDKIASLQVQDAAGNVIGTAGSTREKTAASAQIAAATSYKESINAYRDSLAKGRIMNPYSEAAIERKKLHDTVVARGRKAMELGVSNANLQLEHGIVGGDGIGPSALLHPMSSPESLGKLADEVDRVANVRIATSLRAGQPVGDYSKVPTVPTVGEKLTGAAKKKGAAPVDPDVDDMHKMLDGMGIPR